LVASAHERKPQTQPEHPGDEVVVRPERLPQDLNVGDGRPVSEVRRQHRDADQRSDGHHRGVDRIGEDV